MPADDQGQIADTPGTAALLPVYRDTDLPPRSELHASGVLRIEDYVAALTHTWLRN